MTRRGALLAVHLGACALAAASLPLAPWLLVGERAVVGWTWTEAKVIAGALAVASYFSIYALCCGLGRPAPNEKTAETAAAAAPSLWPAVLATGVALGAAIWGLVSVMRLLADLGADVATIRDTLRAAGVLDEAKLAELADRPSPVRPGWGLWLAAGANLLGLGAVVVAMRQPER